MDRYQIIVEVEAESLAQATEIVEAWLHLAQKMAEWPDHDPDFDVLGPLPL